MKGSYQLTKAFENQTLGISEFLRGTTSIRPLVQQFVNKAFDHSSMVS
jgi:hypothetical protein